MRRYQKWLSLGLLALTPGVTLAGPLNTDLVQSGPVTTRPSPASQAAATPAKPKPNANQKLAEKVKASLNKAKFKGYDIEIEVRDGIVTLDGMVTSAKQREMASRAAKVSGVTRVNNRLIVADERPRMPVQQTGAMMGPRPPAAPTQFAAPQMPPSSVRQAAFQGGIEGPDPIQSGLAPAPFPAGSAPNGMAPGGAPYGMAPAPMGPGSAMPPAPPYSASSHAVYNQPNFPNYSWPTYAQYPNYAAVQYPSQYAASAWPYIGPFYPYPQVPLGWRRAVLEWDDGYWNLNFRSRTERWWWFLNPQNW